MKSFLKKREDYKPLLWVPKNIFLDIKIFDDFSLINSEILFKKNDLLINKKKISGILQEIIIKDNKKYLIVGIGINIIKSPNITNYPTTNGREIRGFKCS